MFRTLAFLAAFAAAVPAFADDDRRWRDDDRRHRNEDRRYENDRDRRYGDNNGRYGYGNDRRDRGRDRIVRQRATPVERTISDLRRAQSRNRYDGEKREHFERAFYHLSRFNSDWNRGVFSKDSLDDAIERIDKLANSDQISAQDRNTLRRDLSDLRSFRSSRGDSYSYRR